MSKTTKKAIIGLSGGLDSAVLATKYMMEGYTLTAVTFNYGSKHNVYENAAAKKFAFCLQMRFGREVEFHLIDVQDMFKQIGGSALTEKGKEVPEGHYEEESMRQTVVPGRNLIFASIMAAMAEARGIPTVLLATHAGDHYIYPDCRPEFNGSMRCTVSLSSDKKVAVETPFTYKSKADIVHIGQTMSVPFKYTRTCYKAQSTACGKCGACQERLAAFNDNRLTDPIEYECRDILPKPEPLPFAEGGD